jgi:hypothetical protein
MGLLDGWGFNNSDSNNLLGAPNGGGGGSLLNPSTLPLLSMAAALGNAARPSRLPVPLGSVFGDAAGGLAAGIQAGQQGQLSQQELYGRQIQNALNALTLRGYNRLQQDTGGNPPTAGGALAASMTPGGAASPAPSTSGGIPVDPNAQPGADNSAFTADPNSPGAELRPALHGGLLVPHFQPQPGTYLGNLASFESSGDPNATNAKSSALGPFQFTKNTWGDVYSRYLQKRGFPNDPTDPTASAVGADAYARENAPVLANSLNRSPQDSELALAHFLGPTGAVRMLNGNPDRPATDFASPQAVAANPKMFYKPDGSNLTVGELRGIFDQKFGAGATALASGASSGAAPSAPGSLLSGAQPQAGAPLPQGSAGAAPQGQAAPLFSLPHLYRQYEIMAATPGMAQQAAGVLSLIQKGLPEGAQLLADGSVVARPGFDRFVMGKELSAKGYTQQPNGTWALDPGVIAGEGAVAGAKKAAELPYTLTEARPGNVTLLGGKPIYQNPIGIPGVDNQNRPTMQYVTPAMSGGNSSAAPPSGGAVTPSGAPSPVGAAGPRPGNLPPAGGNAALPANSYVTGLDPLTHASLEKRGTELENYGQSLQDGASSAVNAQFLIDQMRRESGNGAGWTPGTFADWVGDARALFNGVGLSGPATDAALANYQAFQKNSMQLVTQATRAVSPRAAVQEMQMIREALPGSHLSSGGLGFIFDQLSANNDFSIAKAKAAEAWRGSHSGVLAGFDSNWNQNVSPFAFLVNRMSAPDLKAMAANLQQTTQGRALMQRLISETQYAKSNGLWQDGAQ